MNNNKPTGPVMAEHPVQGRDIVVVSIQPWYYELGSNCKNIATQFARHNRVLYVNSPLTRKTFVSRQKSAGVKKHCEIIKSKKNTIQPVMENMWELYPVSLLESINWVPSTRIFKSINRVNSRRFAADIRRGLHEMGFRDFILFNDNNIYNGYSLKELLHPDMYIYYCRDFLQGYAFYQPHSLIMEPELLRRADLVVANSTYYAEYCSGYNNRSYYIGQGCNIDLFDVTRDRQVPEDMKRFTRPVIGYVGALDSTRLDEKIIETIARAQPQWQVVLVGPEDENFARSSLHALENVHFLGRRDISQLPDYVYAFDVCINPQKINTVTNGNYPLKIDEYLAMGKPVVATRTQAMKLFESHTRLADVPEEYPALVEAALGDRSEEAREERIRFGRSHTWENSMKLLYRAMQQP